MAYYHGHERYLDYRCPRIRIGGIFDILGKEAKTLPEMWRSARKNPCAGLPTASLEVPHLRDGHATANHLLKAFVRAIQEVSPRLHRLTRARAILYARCLKRQKKFQEKRINSGFLVCIMYGIRYHVRASAWSPRARALRLAEDGPSTSSRPEREACMVKDVKAARWEKPRCERAEEKSKK